MARNRQRAKERQARRKAEQGDGGAVPADVDPVGSEPAPEPAAPETEARAAVPPEEAPESDLPDGDAVEEETPELINNAPPEDVGTSSQVLEYEQDLEEEFGPEAEETTAPVRGPRGMRGGEAVDDVGDGSGRKLDHAGDDNRPRVVQFLAAVWAELQRVQWPDRQALTTLTGVVLGFVLIAGGYLGLLDAIFSRVIQAIL